MLSYEKTNLNNYIKVKLTEHGRKIYRNSFISIGLAEPRIKVDEEGFTRFQIHDFISTFGEYLHLGCQLPCDVGVQIEIEPKDDTLEKLLDSFEKIKFDKTKESEKKELIKKIKSWIQNKIHELEKINEELEQINEAIEAGKC